MTRSHEDKIEKDGEVQGYSIRVGKTLPTDAVNLAYVNSPDLIPNQNLSIQRTTGYGKNKLDQSLDPEYELYPDENFLLRQTNGQYRFSGNQLFVTDEFSIPKTAQDVPKALYYEAEVKGLFDARNASVVEYLNGYIKEPIREPLNYNSISHTEPNDLLYLGSKIKITSLNGTDIWKAYQWKVKLIRQEGEGIPDHAYKIVIYTNFRGTKEDTFLIRYEKYNSNGTHTKDYTEVLNAYPFFNEVEKSEFESLIEQPKVDGAWKPQLNEKEYAIETTDKGEYMLYAPSQVLVADNVTRPAHQFSYRVTGNLKTKLSSSNPGTIKIGVAYLNESVFGVEDLTGIIKKMYESKYRAPYLDFENPHPPASYSGLKESPMYWKVDLESSGEYLYDYDLIIITGYGSYEMGIHNDALRSYLENGGCLWIDNAGSGIEVLDLQNFFLNVSFSKVKNTTGFKTLGTGNRNDQYLGRLYVIDGDSPGIGYGNINPEIVFGSGESGDLWQKAIRYSNNQPSVMYKTMFEKGTVVVSNCGMTKAISHSESDDIKLAINMLLLFTEEKWVGSPWIKDYVFHRDNVFEQEYKINNKEVYVDDRSDQDSTQIVAKKILKNTVRDALIPYLDPSYYSARGTFHVEVQSDTGVLLLNSGFEVGRFNEELDTYEDKWTITKTNAIPSWNANVISGKALLEHVSSATQRGTKAVKVSDTETTGTHAYWSTRKENLEAGTYRVEGWIKTENVAAVIGPGAMMSVYTASGSKISSSPVFTGTRDWTKIQFTFGLQKMESIDIRIGFTEGRAKGSVWLDSVQLYSLGSVHMTPENDGNKTLYAYAIRPKSNIFDLQSQGFTYADITTHDPYVEVIYTIRSFVFAWDNVLNRYVRKYGEHIAHEARVRQSEGNVSLGTLSALLPPLKGGQEWVDKNNVFFEIFVGTPEGAPANSHFVNVGFFNARTGQYYFSKSGDNLIGWSDIYGTSEGDQNTIVAQMWTNYYTIAATKRRYSVQVNKNDEIELEHPATMDERDSWFLRIRNGRMTKKEMDHKTYRTYHSDGTSSWEHIHYDRYYNYTLPEYDRQAFAPGRPWKKVNHEIAEYINDTTIRIQNAPLYVQKGSSSMEEATKLNDPNYVDGRSRYFKAIRGNWDTRVIPKVYLDETESGHFIQITDGYDIDYLNGMVIFEEGKKGNIQVSYSYGNLSVVKKKYQNNMVNQELLVSSDGKTFVAKNKNWLAFPSPVIYIHPYGTKDPIIAPIETYQIDYETGIILFYEEMRERVLASYQHSTNEELKVRDCDIQNGLIYLESPITFKDEIVVSYYYEERFVEYRGYYDETSKRFMSLDLNPSEGHYCTFPRVYHERNGTTTRKISYYEKMPTSKLLNKIIFVYILPTSDSRGMKNDHAIRHCFSREEWVKIQQVNPTAILLGTVYIREQAKVSDITVIDTRRRGGGLKESIKKETMDRKEPLSRSYWDMGQWEGQAYYTNGVLTIQVPKTVLEREGGQFTEKQVNDMIKKYVAFGVYYIVEYV